MRPTTDRPPTLFYLDYYDKSNEAFEMGLIKYEQIEAYAWNLLEADKKRIKEEAENEDR